ncbi:MAG: hypothetical protein R5N74_06635, partial [Cutibacterium granulosum]|nr:hypothetical protein [Cutibacterium granulosum]
GELVAVSPPALLPACPLPSTPAPATSSGTGHPIAVVAGDAPWGGDGGHPDHKVTTDTRT